VVPRGELLSVEIFKMRKLATFLVLQPQPEELRWNGWHDEIQRIE